MDDNISNINTVIELVLDELKSLTYVSLCKELCVHVNYSKSILHEAVGKLQKEKPEVQLNINYVLSGLVDDNKAKTIVCTELDLPSTRKLFKSIFFEHIYSISKGKPIVDKVALISSNMHEDLSLCSGLIKNNLCVKRPLLELNELKEKSHEVIDAAVKPQTSKGSVKEVTDNKVVTPQKTKSEPTINHRADMESDNNLNYPKDEKSKKNFKTQKGIAGFFNKANSAPVVKTNSVENKCGDKEKGTKNKNFALTVEDNTMEVDDNKSKLKSIKKDVKEVTNIKKTQTLTNVVKKNAKVDKKRKRVLQVSDSESDNEKDPFEDASAMQIKNESDDEIPPTPTPTVQVKAGILNPKKRRKVIDKTYTDEDGYILTRKEEIYESCSDTETENCSNQNVVPVDKKQIIKKDASPQKPAKNIRKKIASPQKGKQSSIMSFFQKK